MDIRKIIREELEDFQWVTDIVTTDVGPLDGVTFNYTYANKSQQSLVYTIEDNGGDKLLVHFKGQYQPTPYTREEVQDSFLHGIFLRV